MPAPPIDARAFGGEAVSVTPCGSDGAIVRVKSDRELPPLRAARFFMLKRADRVSPEIPRPFSVYRQLGNELEFLLKLVGPGTRALAECTKGTRVEIVGPLGNGWPTLDGTGAPWVMLAGGIGSAPFYMGIEQSLAGMDGARAAKREQLFYLYGASTRSMLYDLEAFQALGVPTFTCTMDGSHGAKGNVLELLTSLQRRGVVPERVRLLACGPERMLEAVEHFAEERGLDCWLSLESLMGCGVGICNGCPVPTVVDGPKGSWPNMKCCVEGPVFSTKDVTLVGMR